MKELVLVKLGGSILTDKERPCSICMDVIRDVSKQLRFYIKSNPAGRLILGNGGGSFGHYYAQMYSLNEGVSGAEELLGMCKGKSGNRYLNNTLVQCLNSNDLPAVSFSVDPMFQDYMVHGSTVPDESLVENWEYLFALLENGIIPVVYGDIISESVKGCKIISTEQIFLSLLHSQNIKNYSVKKIICCTGCDGVLDSDGNLISIIDRDNFADWTIFQKKGKEYDVTGGMGAKVRMAMDPLVTCPVQIINGKTKGNLFHALAGDEKIGTMITG